MHLCIRFTLVLGLGAALMQDGHPVAYESLTMSPSERNYATGEQELLAVVHAMRTWRPYLEGVRHRVITDHKPNTFLPVQTELLRRKARWAEYLPRFDMEWEYKPGRVNGADPLNRKPTIRLGVVLTRRATDTAAAGEVAAVQGEGSAQFPVQRSVAAPQDAVGGIV